MSAAIELRQQAFWYQKGGTPTNQTADYHWHPSGDARLARLQPAIGAEVDALLSSGTCMAWLRTFKAHSAGRPPHQAAVAVIVDIPSEARSQSGLEWARLLGALRVPPAAVWTREIENACSNVPVVPGETELLPPRPLAATVSPRCAKVLYEGGIWPGVVPEPRQLAALVAPLPVAPSAAASILFSPSVQIPSAAPSDLEAYYRDVAALWANGSDEAVAWWKWATAVLQASDRRDLANVMSYWRSMEGLLAAITSGRWLAELARHLEELPVDSSTPRHQRLSARLRGRAAEFATAGATGSASRRAQLLVVLDLIQRYGPGPPVLQVVARNLVAWHLVRALSAIRDNRTLIYQPADTLIQAPGWLGASALSRYLRELGAAESPWQTLRILCTDEGEANEWRKQTRIALRRLTTVGAEQAAT